MGLPFVPIEVPMRERRYPPFFEKAVPVALAAIAAIMVILLLVIVAVVAGVFPGAR